MTSRPSAGWSGCAGGVALQGSTCQGSPLGIVAERDGFHARARGGAGGRATRSVTGTCRSHRPAPGRRHAATHREPPGAGRRAGDRADPSGRSPRMHRDEPMASIARARDSAPGWRKSDERGSTSPRATRAPHVQNFANGSVDPRRQEPVQPWSDGYHALANRQRQEVGVPLAAHRVPSRWTWRSSNGPRRGGWISTSSASTESRGRAIAPIQRRRRPNLYGPRSAKPCCASRRAERQRAEIARGHAGRRQLVAEQPQCSEIVSSPYLPPIVKFPSCTRMPGSSVPWCRVSTRCEA